MIPRIGNGRIDGRPVDAERLRSPLIALRVVGLGQNEIVEAFAEAVVVRNLVLEIERAVRRRFALGDDVVDGVMRVVVVVDWKKLSGEKLRVADLIAAGLPLVRRQRGKKLVQCRVKLPDGHCLRRCFG